MQPYQFEPEYLTDEERGDGEDAEEQQHEQDDRMGNRLVVVWRKIRKKILGNLVLFSVCIIFWIDYRQDNKVV